MNIVILLGAPGSGKGTIAGKLAAEHDNLKHVSSGDLLRGAVAKGTPAGVEAKGYMEKGNLVPDALIAQMIKDVVAETAGDITMLLDGFPRNLAQAKILEEMGAPIKSVVLVDVPDEVIHDRIAGRRTCPKCKAGYHVKALPHVPEVQGGIPRQGAPPQGRGNLRQVRRGARHPQGRQPRDGEGPPRRLPPRNRAAYQVLRGEGSPQAHRRRPGPREERRGVPRGDVTQ